MGEIRKGRVVEEQACMLQHAQDFWNRKETSDTDLEFLTSEGSRVGFLEETNNSVWLEGTQHETQLWRALMNQQWSATVFSIFDVLR